MREPRLAWFPYLMSTFLDIPQKPRDKTRRDEDDEDQDDEIIDMMSVVSDGEKRGRKLAPGVVDHTEASRRLSPSPFPEFDRLSPSQFRDLSPAPNYEKTTWKTSLWAFWMRNKPLVMVFGAQAFGAFMNLAARLLEREEEGQALGPLQMLSVRMSLTTVISCLYMWWKNVPHFTC